MEAAIDVIGGCVKCMWTRKNIKLRLGRTSHEIEMAFQVMPIVDSSAVECRSMEERGSHMIWLIEYWRRSRIVICTGIALCKVVVNCNGSRYKSECMWCRERERDRSWCKTTDIQKSACFSIRMCWCCINRIPVEIVWFYPCHGIPINIPSNRQ